MVLTSESVSTLRREFLDDNLPLILAQPIEGVTLAGLLELCCAFRTWGRQQHPKARELFEHLCTSIPVLRALAACYRRAATGPAQRASSAALSTDEALIQVFGSSADVREEHGAWDNFQMEFIRRAKAAGIADRWRWILVSLIKEMVENVPDHSSAPGQPMAPMIFGVHIAPGEVHFSVNDIGRGSLASLRENPAWRDLPDSLGSLVAIATKGATSKAIHEEGGGFKDIFRVFADHGGWLRLRSGDGSAVVAYTSGGDREMATATCAELGGMQVSASWVNCRRPAEAMLTQVSFAHEPA